MLFVHIGMPKTGTKTIQMLLAARPAFLERAGVHVPVAGLTRFTGHSGLMELVQGPDDPWLHRRLDPAAWDGLRDELTRCPARRFIVSSEVFGDGRPQSSDWAKAFAALGEEAGVDVEVLAYVRPQYQWLEARYSQLVKNGRETRPFEACLEECLVSGGGTGNAPQLRYPYTGLDYNSVFEPWREVLGDRLKIHTLDDAQRAGGLVRHFSALIGANEVADVTCLPRSNQRPGAKFVEVLRLTSAALGTVGFNVPLLAYSPWQKVRAGLPALLDHDIPFRPLSDAEIHALTERYADSNTQFGRDYGVDAAFHSKSRRTDSPRPVRIAWQDFGDGERDRVRSFVLDALGVDLGTGRVKNEPAWTAPQSRPPSYARIHYRLRLLASQARSVRHPSDAVPFLRWLRWRLSGILRPRRRLMSATSTRRQPSVARR